MKYWLFLFSSVALAQEHGAHVANPHSVPWDTILVEVYNFALLFGGLIYLLRHTILAHFKDRAVAYNEAVERSRRARQAAESSRQEISSRLDKLKAGAQDSVKQAEAEASELKAKMVRDAGAMAARLEQDAKLTANAELARAVDELRAELLHSSLNAARTNLAKTVGSSEQKRLQTEFVDKIQVVGR